MSLKTIHSVVGKNPCPQKDEISTSLKKLTFSHEAAHTFVNVEEALSVVVSMIDKRSDIAFIFWAKIFTKNAYASYEPWSDFTLSFRLQAI